MNYQVKCSNFFANILVNLEKSNKLNTTNNKIV